MMAFRSSLCYHEHMANITFPNTQEVVVQHLVDMGYDKRDAFYFTKRETGSTSNNAKVTQTMFNKIVDILANFY